MNENSYIQRMEKLHLGDSFSTFINIDPISQQVNEVSNTVKLDDFRGIVGSKS